MVGQLVGVISKKVERMSYSQMRQVTPSFLCLAGL